MVKSNREGGTDKISFIIPTYLSKLGNVGSNQNNATNWEGYLKNFVERREYQLKKVPYNQLQYNLSSKGEWRTRDQRPNVYEASFGGLNALEIGNGGKGVMEVCN
jgi:hypothetical protein